MTVEEVLTLLGETGNTAVLLRGKRHSDNVVVVAPSLVGRVLCVGTDGLGGHTESYILPDVIRNGFRQSGPGGIWNNFGGEERVWLAPEGGPFALFFPPHMAQTMNTYTVPEPLNSTQFAAVRVSDNLDYVDCSASISLKNIRGTVFQVEMARRVRILENCPFTMECEERVRVVGFETSTTVLNAGETAWSRETGAPAVWTLGQFMAKRHRIVVVPFCGGRGNDEAMAVSTENFRLLNPEDSQGLSSCYKVERRCVMFRADGEVQTKLEFPHKTSMGLICAVDISEPSLTMVECKAYPEMDYVAGYALPYSGDPYDGGALSSFVLSKDSSIPPFLELECCSPALFLKPGESYEHVSRTYHIKGTEDLIRGICKKHLHADWSALKAFDGP